MHLTRFFLPLMKETPADAQIVSHRLMLRAGLVRQAASGIYSWLPMGIRVLNRIEKIVHSEQLKAGSNPILMPTIQPASLWRESGRYEDYGKEMLRITDRHDRDMLYGPTNEELVTDIFRHSVHSYRDLPMNLYQIQWKFRDEIRPRFGVMRGREFLMKDGYSFDISRQDAEISYAKMMASYLRTFSRMGLTAVPMKADSGPIGGDMSHEFLILAKSGESEVFVDRLLVDNRHQESEVDYQNTDNLLAIRDRWTSHYARTDETHEEEIFFSKVPEERRMQMRGIEVAHIFYFGTKYSQAMAANVTNSSGDLVPVHMGSYGIGVSRLVGAIIEANHDDNGIIWPDAVAPFHVGMVNLKQGDKQSDAACEDLLQSLTEASIEVLYDDRDERAGVKFATMDLIGLPWRITVGPRGLKEGQVELTRRASGETEYLPPEQLPARLSSALERVT